MLFFSIYQINSDINYQTGSLYSSSKKQIITYAHSGRTDRYGCHNDYKKGTYHCH